LNIKIWLERKKCLIYKFNGICVCFEISSRKISKYFTWIKTAQRLWRANVFLGWRNRLRFNFQRRLYENYGCGYRLRALKKIMRPRRLMLNCSSAGKANVLEYELDHVCWALLELAGRARRARDTIFLRSMSIPMINESLMSSNKRKLEQGLQTFPAFCGWLENLEFIGAMWDGSPLTNC